METAPVIVPVPASVAPAATVTGPVPARMADSPSGSTWITPSTASLVFAVNIASITGASKRKSGASVVLLAGSLSTREIVANQSGAGPGGFLPAWNLIRLGVVPFVIFVIAATAEMNRPPSQRPM